METIDKPGIGGEIFKLTLLKDWYGKIPEKEIQDYINKVYEHSKERKIKIWTTEAGLKMFDEAIKKQFEKIRVKNKYYTPDIEDIHIGYECDRQMLISGEPSGEFFKDRLTETTLFDVLEHFSQIRTPFLTKEQIENEGFKFVRADNFSSWYEKNEIIVQTVDNGNMGMYIVSKDWIDGERTLFVGRVPSINEFRKVIKMIGV